MTAVEFRMTTGMNAASSFVIRHSSFGFRISDFVILLMARILITSGPTRQYLDPVRYLTNASSGRMGAALAAAALELGHSVVVVSGPVEAAYHEAAKVIPVVSTEDMLAAAREAFETCDGLIGAAAPCDYRPERVETHKIAKTGEPLLLRLLETDDVVATLAAAKGRRWVVGFALETEDQRLRALAKLERKSCDLMVSNGVEAMNSPDNRVEILDPAGAVVGEAAGTKESVAREILAVIQDRLIRQAS
jgi:phosphopantothenoylcysteine decarboxylase/phosphopantothenate--cysteine ligase